jgi:hypothetical protein
MTRPIVAVLALVVLVAGFGLGRWVTPVASDPPSTSPAGPGQAAATEPAPRSIRSLVCAPVRRAARVDSSCDEIELRERWCEAELADCSKQRDAVRHAWPEADTVESPERWSEVVDEAFEACGIDAELEVVDCAEYPCTAALRPKTAAADAASHEREVERLTQAVRACPQLRAAFNVGDGQDEALDVFRLDAPCGAEHERFFAFMAVDTRGEAFAKQQAEDDDIVERDVMRWMYRRADDLVGMWPCPE